MPVKSRIFAGQKSHFRRSKVANLLFCSALRLYFRRSKVTNCVCAAGQRSQNLSVSYILHRITGGYIFFSHDFVTLDRRFLKTAPVKDQALPVKSHVLLIYLWITYWPAPLSLKNPHSVHRFLTYDRRLFYARDLIVLIKSSGFYYTAFL